MPERVPKKLSLYVYQVGFGDCMLLKFHYSDTMKRNILIDFGSMRYPPNAPSGFLRKVAQRIQQDCDGKLNVIVATHRHRDHIRGFETNSRQNGPGDIIATCDPDVIIQPWTEHPDIATDALTGPAQIPAAMGFIRKLNNMNQVAEGIVRECDHLTALPAAERDQLRFIGEDNIKNRNAVENLIRMGQGKQRLFVRHGDQPKIGRLLPRVKLHVLGPPTLEQTETIRSQSHHNDDQFWHFRAAAATEFSSMQEQGPVLFPDAAIAGDTVGTRWIRERLQRLRGESLLQIVRVLDKALNNTSVILLFEVQDKLFLFPGDAQWENWAYALSKSAVKDKLKNVDLYKVGHHGSLNATPKKLWNLFDKRSPASPQAMRSVLSTMEGVYGNPSRHTEVPRTSLVQALEQETRLTATASFDSNEWRRVIDIDI